MYGSAGLGRMDASNHVICILLCCCHFDKQEGFLMKPSRGTF